MREEDFRKRLRRAIGEPPQLARPNLSRPDRPLVATHGWLTGAVAGAIAATIVFALIASHGGLHLPRVDSKPGMSGSGATVDRSSLEGRPLSLQPLASGQACPVDKPVGLRIRTSSGKWPNYGFGSGPVYLSGQTMFYTGSEQVIVLLTDPTYSGPALVRSSRLDGTGSLTFRELDASTGVNEVWLAKTSSPPNWGAWESMMSSSAPGCYGIQLDGSNFTEVVIISVLPSPAPGG